jgi:hypothetical protein
MHDFIDRDDLISINEEKRYLSKVMVKGETMIQSMC